MLNFTVGPVQMSEEELKIGSCQIPYFRTSNFSELMLENENMMKQLTKASEDSRVVFITGSGTAGMEATVMNTLSLDEKVLVVNGGSFGQRFCDLLELHSISYESLTLSVGQKLNLSMLQHYENQGYTAFVVNMHETSTGVLYDMDLISDFCKRNNMFLIVDAISSFLADEFKMNDWGVDVMITGSQKALACPPGVVAIILSKNAIERVERIHCRCMYLDLNVALKNGERGQTPFTPAVGILIQIHERLKNIMLNGGAEREIERVSELAMDFRERIRDLPLKIVSESLSNAVTPLSSINVSAYSVFEVLKEEYGIWICPNGGELQDKIFRVGHLGALTKEDNSVLVSALRDMHRRKLL